MSYVKNYNVGRIQLDLPTSNYFHELPLISFGDIHGSVNLSLVFNYGMKAQGGNPYSIAAGYKLNLQKRLIMSDGVPSAFQGGNGKIINLNRTGDIYTFDDDTQRILRSSDDGYELENSDYSRELYDTAGRIVAVYDKYNALVLLYTYNTDNTLRYVTYRRTKRINFTYDTSSRLNSIRYDGKIIRLTYTLGMQLAHYNGVTFNFTYAGMNFGVTATATENSESISYSTKINKNNDNTLVISDFINQENVNTTTYKFSGLVTSYNTNFLNVEITDNNGVTKRIQFKDKKPLYSYEIGASDVEFNNEKYSGNIQIYNAFNYKSIYNSGGVQGVSDGYPLTNVDCSTEVSWQAEFSSSDKFKGVYTLSGWIKLLDDNYASDTIPLHIAKNTHTITYSQYLPKPPVNQWSYFYITFPWDESSVCAYIKKYLGNIETKDFRLGFQATHVLSDDDSTFAPISVDVLIRYDGDVAEYIPIFQAKFICDGIDISSYGRVFYEDLLKYKINQKKGINLTEFYCENLRSVFNTSSSASIIVTDAANTYSYNLSECYLGKRSYTKKGVITTRVRDNDNDSFLVIEALDENNNIVSHQNLDSNLDIVHEMTDGLTISYQRSNDLVVSEQILGLYDRGTSYSTDSEGNPTISQTDEFNNTTVYTLDSKWGNVKSITLPDGTVITDEYDDDACAKLSRTFATGGRSNIFEYFGGNLSRLQSGSLVYDFTYDKGNMSAVNKNDEQTEEHEITDTKSDSYYPSKANEIYSDKVTFDKYGRVERIDGKVKNTYDVYPGKNENGDFFTLGDSGENALLAVSEDLTNGKKTKFAYLSDQLKLATVFNSSGTKLTTESFEYDDLNRMKSDKFTYETGKAVKLEIEYDTSTTAVTPDNRVKKYTYKIGDDNTIDNTIDDVKATINNSYADAFKRLTRKEIEVGSASYKKSIIYDKTRIKRVMDVKGGSTLHNVSYSYDAMGRIISESDTADTSFKNTYTYDTFGQLIRENNKALDKTYVYEYNGSGNIIGAKTYSYTTGALDGVNPTTTDSYAYDSTVKDRLTAFKGDAITYNSMGCPVKLVDGSTTYTYTWTKGKLTGFAKFSSLGGRHSYTYTYDAYGRRIRKLYTYAPGSQISAVYTTRVTTNYTYDLSGRLIREQVTETDNQLATYQREFLYLYDGDNIVGVEFTRNGTTSTYYFDRNIKGDVVGIFNSSGTQVAKYEYDAWGNSRLSTLASNNFSGYNSIRYRGYYYDTETGFYFLNSRYYSPQWRRFIEPAGASSLNPDSVNGLNLYCYAGNNPVGVAYNNSVASAIDSGDFTRSTAGIGNAISTDSLAISKGRLSLPAVPWLVDNATTIYGAVSSLSTGFPILSHYFKYASVINDEFKLYGISKWKTSLQLSNVSFKMGALDGILIGVNVLLDMYDSYQRGVSTEGIMVGGALTAATGVGMFYLNKGIMWAATTIGTAICPGLGTGIGFAVGLVGSILVDIFLGGWIADWIDNNIK